MKMDTHDVGTQNVTDLIDKQGELRHYLRENLSEEAHVVLSCPQSHHRA